MTEGPRFHSHVSPRSLSTLEGLDPILNYPKHWELMKWYLCWRKYPYAEVHAALVVPDRGEEYSHYLCPVTREHWHIGRTKSVKFKQLTQRAKHTYRRAVRHEIWSEEIEKRRAQDD